MAKYTIEIYQYNVVANTFTRIDIIETFKNLKYFSRLNGIGACTFSLSLQDGKATSANLMRYVNQVAIKRYGTVVWFGPITRVSGIYENVGGYLNIECASYQEHLRARFADKIIQYTQIDQCQLAWNVISAVTSRTNGTLGLTQGSHPVSVNRDRTYEYKNVSDALTELSGVVNGFDYLFNPVVNATTGIVSSITFDCYYPYLGNRRSDLPTLKIGENIKQIQFRTDSTLCNSGIAEGSGTGTTIISTLDYGSSQQAYTRREVVISEKDVSVPATLSEDLTVYLNDSSVEQYAMDIQLYQDCNIKYGDFSLGDILLIDAVMGQYTRLKKDGRVIELAVDVDNQGAETITPKLSIIP